MDPAPRKPIGRPPRPGGTDPVRGFRIPNPRYHQFQARAPADHMSRIVNQLIAWYLREPDARLPERPTP